MKWMSRMLNTRLNGVKSKPGKPSKSKNCRQFKIVYKD